MAQEPTRRMPVEEVETHHEHAVHESGADYGVHAALRIVYLVFGAFQVLLLIRFLMKLGDASAANGVIATLYGVTEPLVRPFQGIFPVPPAGVQIEIATLLAIAFLVLVEALIVALVRALSPRY